MLNKKQLTNDLTLSVDISGLGCEAFQQSIMNIFLWDLRMSRHFEPDAWKSWNDPTGGEHATVRMSNRVLTPAFLCKGSESVPLPEFLGKAAKKLTEEGTHRYIADNEIDLYEHLKTPKSNK